MKSLQGVRFRWQAWSRALLAVTVVFAVPAGAATDPHLSAWFANGLSGKTICLVGDSTTSNATDLINELNNFHRKEGEGLYGVKSILIYGENGASLSAFLSDGVAHGVTTTIAAQADLYVISYGINDVRLGQTSEAQLTNLLIAAVNRIIAGVPKASIVLRMPNSFLSADVGAYGFVQPNSSAPAYSSLLRNAYERLRNRWSNVAVFDAQAEVFGRSSPASSAFMQNQVHPSSAGYVALARPLVALIGVQPAPDPVLLANALAQNPAAPYTLYARAVEDTDVYNQVATGRWVASSLLGAPNGFVDFSWPANKAADIHCGDVIQMNVNHVFALPATCLVIAIGQNTRIYNLGPALPAYTMSGGTVSVWRKW